MIQFSKNVSKVNFQSTEMIVSSNNAHQWGWFLRFTKWTLLLDFVYFSCEIILTITLPFIDIPKESLWGKEVLSLCSLHTAPPPYFYYSGNQT